DHTNLKPTATPEDIEKLCAEARQFGFKAVCVNSCYVALASELLKGSDVLVCAVAGFPLGAMSTAAKKFEAEEAVKDGAGEIDMVMNIGLAKDGDWKGIEEDILAVKQAARGAVLKVIIETCYLTDEEKIAACEAAVRAGAEFVKTSTGFGPAGATIEDVRLMKKAVEGKALVKAAGGVRDKATALAMIEAGADRLGTSNGVAIIQE
ncbi:TPA: deoxyribose-phosphate aldolase, partial [Candidatus Azambacteria bacterium]|nr:deoxyribose-phosphate aldolase [Candidatus Azambacteria bacterium]HCB36002.1 deoxyribose-phosphate aldolase [Candidatus Azambacteria bacterium]